MLTATVRPGSASPGRSGRLDRHACAVRLGVMAARQPLELLGLGSSPGGGAGRGSDICVDRVPITQCSSVRHVRAGTAAAEIFGGGEYVLRRLLSPVRSRDGESVPVIVSGQHAGERGHDARAPVFPRSTQRSLRRVPAGRMLTCCRSADGRRVDRCAYPIGFVTHCFGCLVTNSERIQVVVATP